MWHPEPDQLALAALPAEQPDPQVTDHLLDCPLCRGQVESLRRTVDLARAGGDTVVVDGGPPDRVWQAISDELAITEARPPARRRIAVPVLAAVLALLVGLTGGYLGATLGSTPDPDPTVVARLGPIGTLDPAGSGRVEMVGTGDGDRMEVTVTGVAGLDNGDYLEVWLLDQGATRLVSLGGLARQGDAYRGTFTVPAGLPFVVFGTVDVSVEHWDGDPAHSGESILRGALT